MDVLDWKVNVITVSVQRRSETRLKSEWLLPIWVVMSHGWKWAVMYLQWTVPVVKSGRRTYSRRPFTFIQKDCSVVNLGTVHFRWSRILILWTVQFWSFKSFIIISIDRPLWTIIVYFGVEPWNIILIELYRMGIEKWINQKLTIK